MDANCNEMSSQGNSTANIRFQYCLKGSNFTVWAADFAQQ